MNLALYITKKIKKKFEDTKGAIRRKSNKDRTPNDQIKMNKQRTIKHNARLKMEKNKPH